jgi:magnesium chelatase family protein
VLFLDELPEFDRRALEGLREPLERGEVSVVRAGYRVRFPSRFLLVAAMNPCRCGNHGVEDRACRCSPREVERYRDRISGPLLDRFDLQVEVPAVPVAALASKAAPGPASRGLREAVLAVQRAELARGCRNAALDGKALQAHAALDREGEAFLARASERLRLSARAHVRVRRLARTIADLAGAPEVLREHLQEAVSFRLRERATA